MAGMTTTNQTFTKKSSFRRYELDWLRVLVFGLLIIHHVAMFFAPYAYYIKNDIIYPIIMLPMYFIQQWRLPILFLISGMGTFYSLSNRSKKAFAKERIIRLFLPLMIGILFIVPPQVYFERLDREQFTGSYFDFWPSQAFIGIYPEGNISWHHLWFLAYLLLYSLLLLPAFMYLKKRPDSWLLKKVRQIVVKPASIFWFIIPLYLWEILLEPYFPSTRALYNDWYNVISYFTLFFFGFLLISAKDIFWNSIMKHRRIFLYCGIAGFLLLAGSRKLLGDSGVFHFIIAFFKVFNLWSWILVLFGYASKYLNKPGPVLSYANQAVYPFYILHQTITIVIGYYLMHLKWGFFTKFTLMALGTFLFSWIIYEFGIRRWKWIRPLFGLKPIPLEQKKQLVL